MKILCSQLTIIILSIFICFPVAGKLENTLKINSPDEEISIGTHLYYIEDKNNSFKITDIIQNKNWVQSKTDKLNFGFSKSKYWFRFSIMNTTGIPQWMFYSKYPLLDKVTIYKPGNNEKYIEEHSGDMIAFSHRKIKDRAITFDLKLPKNKLITFYVKVESESNINCIFSIIRKNQFNRQRADEKLWFGIFFGIIIVICLYNFLIFLKIRDSNYIYYIFFIMTHGLFQMQFHGLSLQYLWPDSPQWNNIALNFFGGQSICWVILFSRSFLQTRINAKIMDKVLLMFLIPALFQMITSFFLSYSIPARVGTVTLMVFPVTLWFSGFFVYRSGYRPARFYLLAWSIYLLFVTMWSLSKLALIETNIITEYGMQIGAAIEAVLLSLALGDKMNILASDKIKTQKELIKQQERSIDIQKEYAESISRFVPKEFLKFLDKENIINVKLGDQVMREMTVLFSDIRSFTKISERMSPQENFNFLNQFLGKVSPVITKHNGFIDKYIGDAIMALFPEKPDDAIAAAIDMIEELNTVNATLDEEKKIDIGVGIHTGNLMLGTIGEPHRMETTVIADSVNVASRLESINKKMKTNIIISLDSLKKCQNPELFQTRNIGSVRLKGKESTVEILEVIGRN